MSHRLPSSLSEYLRSLFDKFMITCITFYILFSVFLVLCPDLELFHEDKDMCVCVCVFPCVFSIAMLNSSALFPLGLLPSVVSMRRKKNVSFYPSSFLTVTSFNKRKTNTKRTIRILLTCAPAVNMRNTQEKWITPWHSPSHHPSHLQLKAKGYAAGEKCENKPVWGGYQAKHSKQGRVVMQV